MKILAALLLLFPSLAWAECSNVGTVLINCDGSTGYQLGNQTYVYGSAGGLQPYNPPAAPQPYNPVPSVQPSYSPTPYMQAPQFDPSPQPDR
jgi:hypothetical protein